MATIIFTLSNGVIVRADGDTIKRGVICSDLVFRDRHGNSGYDAYQCEGDAWEPTNVFDIIPNRKHTFRESQIVSMHEEIVEPENKKGNAK
jgi:hypothetical protein